MKEIGSQDIIRNASDEWTDGWIDRLMDRWMDGCAFCIFFSKVFQSY